MTGSSNAKFILKMIIFTITFYFLLEYVEECDVDTHKGMAIVLSIVTLVSIVFVLLRANKGTIKVFSES